MKTFSLFLQVITSIIFPLYSFAQPNSVTLLDGTTTILSTHNSIQDAYDNIPATLTQAYTIEISGAYNGADESFPITFINKAGASAVNTISIVLEAGIPLLNLYYGGDTSSVFIFDDADWVILNGVSSSGGAALNIHNASDTANFPLVHFINGSSNNIIRRCSFFCSGYTDSAAAIYMGISPLNNSGNSDNFIDHCNINAGTFGYITDGSPGNPNKNNRLYRNVISVWGTCIWEKGGTGNLYIDSNRIDVHANQDWLAENNIIAIENHSDSLFLTKNRMRCYIIPSNTIPVWGIHVKSTSGPNAYISMINNYIRLGVYDNQFSIYYDSLTYAAGIEFDAATEASADIYHNTIRIRGMKSPGSTTPAFTTGFKATTNSNSVYNIENNIITNERFGGINAINVALSINNTAGILNINNNTYNSFTQELAHYNNVYYTTMASYQAAVNAGNETNSNNTPVEFVNVLDQRLYNTSVNNPDLQGIVIPGITEDIEGDARVYPYRGCDEYVVNCVSTVYNAFCNSPIICPGDTIHVWHSIPLTGNGNVYQWQSRPAGSTQPFTDIPGAIYNILITAITQSTEFRVIDSCSTGGLGFITISNVVTVNAYPLPSAAGIAETHNDLTYDFSGINVQNTNSYQWDFGDGSPIDTNAAPQHTYGAYGNYTVTLILTNNCGSDTITLQVNPTGIGTHSLEHMKVLVYPVPATNEVTVSINGDDLIRHITVYDVTGAIVTSIENCKTQKQLISTSSLANGTYIIRIGTDDGTAYGRLQVLR